MRNWFVALIVVVALAGCGGKSPTTPTSDGSGTPGPQPGPLPALWGFVRDNLTDAPLENARVELVDAGAGSLTGRFVLTDASGRYNFFEITGSESFRASKEGYEGQPQRINLAQTSTASFALTPVISKPPREAILPGETKTATVGSADRTCSGLFFIRPCKRFILIVSEGSTLNVRLTWQGGDDIDLELWRDDTQIAKSLICQSCGVGTSQEEFAGFVPSGEYELRAILFAGTGSPVSFTLTVTRAN